VVLAPDGSLWSWGGEDTGWPVLGRGQNGGPVFSTELQPVGTTRDWVQVTAGQDHNLALKSDGTLWAWGANYRGQLGNAQTGVRSTQNLPVPVAPGNDWTRAEAGSVCSYALKKDGTLWAWGLNNFCQLGIGSWMDSPTPVQVGTATNWTLIRAGGVSAGGIQADGTLWIWGGSPGLGNTTPRSPKNLMVPIRISSGKPWVDLAVTYNLWAAVRSDGSLWVWGRDAPGYTGTSQALGEAPARLGDEADWVSVSISRDNLLLRKRNGSWWQITPPDNGAGQIVTVPLSLPGAALAGDTAAGAVAVVTPEREVWAWGTVLGQRSAKDKTIAFAGGLLRRFGWNTDWDQGPGDRVRCDTPWRIRNLDPR